MAEPIEAPTPAAALEPLAALIEAEPTLGSDPIFTAAVEAEREAGRPSPVCE